MDNGRSRNPTRLEQIAQSLAIAIAAISAGLKLYREIQAFRRDSTEFQTLQAKLGNIESQLEKAQRARQFNTGSQEELTTQLTELVV
jgi:alkylation response protein AidB-like acyl-CoA dehydrogenase